MRKWTQSIRRWLNQRRGRRIERALRSRHSRALRDAAELLRQRKETIEELNALADALRSDIEQTNHRASRLERELELAKMENELLSAIHSRDIERVRTETAISVSRAESVMGSLQSMGD